MKKDKKYIENFINHNITTASYDYFLIPIIISLILKAFYLVASD